VNCGANVGGFSAGAGWPVTSASIIWLKLNHSAKMQRLYVFPEVVCPPPISTNSNCIKKECRGSIWMQFLDRRKGSDSASSILDLGRIQRFDDSRTAF
jgi:hypothetical protein